MDDNSYSQFVGWMKIILPLAALGLLSTVFLFARAPDSGSDIPYADVDVETLAEEQRINAPNYSRVADDGATIKISATSANADPNNDQTIEAIKVAAQIITVEGETIDILASQGTVDSQAQTARLSGLARIITSTGYEMETNGVDADLESGLFETTGPVEARAPFGTLSAGRLVIEPATADTNTQVVFKDGVKLIYTRQP